MLVILANSQGQSSTSPVENGLAATGPNRWCEGVHSEKVTGNPHLCEHIEEDTHLPDPYVWGSVLNFGGVFH